MTVNICDLQLMVDIRELINNGYENGVGDNQFNNLALRLFNYQFQSNGPYQRYVIRKGVNPDKVESWEEIPAVVSDVFKMTESPLVSYPVQQAVKRFITSGTKDPKRRGIHYLDKEGMDMWYTSVRSTAKRYLFPDVERIRILALSPDPSNMPYDMSMATGIGFWTKEFGKENSDYLAKISEKGIDVNPQRFVGILKEVEKTSEPVALIDATFVRVSFLDQCKKLGLKFKLPEGSRALDGGGIKNRSREVTKQEIYSDSQDVLGIPRFNCVNLYGLTEDSTQYIDAALRNKSDEPRYKQKLPWSRVIAVHPENFERMPKGEKGILRIFDLANVSSVMSLQTDDLGYEIKDGFEIVGRADSAQARGCSLEYNEFVIAQSG